MRLSDKARALAPFAALSFAAVAAAKAPRHHAAASSAPAASAAPSDAKGAVPAPSGSAADQPAPGGAASASPSAPATSPAPSAEPSPSSSPEPGAAPESTAPEAGEPSPAAGPSPSPLRPEPHVVKTPAKTEPETEEAVAPARDTLGGHFDVGINAAMLVPFGNVVAGIPQSLSMGIGPSFGGDLAYGISRTVMLGAYVDVGLPGAQIPGQSVTTISAGPMIRYHLVQGMAFDPWVSGGLGFRYTKDGNTSFTGVDWCRLALGGDWYPSSNFGFGPFLAMSLGTFFGQSPGSIHSPGLNAHFLLGGRIVFDTPGR